MARPADPSPVRTHGATPAPTARPPTSRLLAVLAAMTAAALVVTWFGADPASESDRSAITSPEVEDTPVTITAPVIAPGPVADPLDRRVPGLHGTLVLTMGTPRGTEVWRWSTGPDGVLERTAPAPDTFDARAAPAGDAIAAIHRSGQDQPILVMGSQSPTGVVFLGVEHYAWSNVEPGAIVWVEQRTARGLVTIHFGEWVGNGVYFKPVGTIPGFDVEGADRLVAFDAFGLAFERYDPATGLFTVTRTALDGTILATAPGAWAGSSTDGVVALTGDATRLVDGETLETLRDLPGSFDTMVWAGDGRIAAASREGDEIDLIDGSAIRTVRVGDIRPSVLGWSADQRFVIATGTVDGGPVLVFVDSATLDTTTVIVSAQPVSVVALG